MWDGQILRYLLTAKIKLINLAMDQLPKTDGNLRSTPRLSQCRNLLLTPKTSGIKLKAITFQSYLGVTT
jgi:hypothetical protein